MNKLLLLSIAALFIFSCSKKSSPAPNPNSAITGKWYYKADTARNYHNGNLETTQAFAITKAPFYQFNSDGTGFTENNDVGSTTQFTYTVNGTVVAFNYPTQTNTSAYTQNASIKQITTSSLVLFFDNSTGTTGNIDEATEIIYMGK